VAKLKATEIHPNPKNPRIIKDDNFKKLVQSLKDFPEMADIREVVVNKDHMILGGNMRYKAMLEAGWKDIPVKIVDLPDAKQKEFIIKDNVSGGEWDWDVLANEWDSEQLDDWGLDIPTDFAHQEIDEDEAPEVSDEPAISKLGEIYQLGRHRLMCGDSTLPYNIASLLGTYSTKDIDMVFTDPPYGILWDGDYKRFTEGYSTRKTYDRMANDEKDFDPRPLIEEYKRCLLFGANCYSDKLPKGNWIVWDKRFENGSAFLADAEVAWYNGSGAIYIIKETSQGFTNSDEAKYHPTQKPVKLLVKIMEKINAEDVLFDPYIGSGSTLIACEQTSRTCCGMEIDPRYVDVIRKRYATFIGESDWEAATPLISGGAAEHGAQSTEHS